MSNQKNKSQSPTTQQSDSEEAQGTNKWQQIAEQAESAEQSVAYEPESPTALDFPSRSKLEEQLTALEKERDEYKNQMTSIRADFENTRRRIERDVTMAYKYSTEKIITALLPIADSLDRALEGTDFTDPKLKAMQEGIRLTAEMLQSTLAKFGVTSIDPAVGSTFNPTYHEAMSLQQNPQAKPNTILQVLQKGYQLHDRVMRPAMVIVASP